MPFENGMLSEILVDECYSTFMVGKWHLTPSNQETAAGPYDRWPLGRGFQRFYGFLGGDTSQWHPDLVYDNHQVEPPKTPEEGYRLSEDLVDKAVSFIADTKQSDPRSLSISISVSARRTPRIDADVTTPFVFNPGALTCGANPGSPVTPDYVGPYTFTGTLHSVTLDVSGELIHDPEAELRVHLARQ